MGRDPSTVTLAELALRYLDHQGALGQPEGTLDRALEDAAKEALRESQRPPESNPQRDGGR